MYASLGLCLSMLCISILFHFLRARFYPPTSNVIFYLVSAYFSDPEAAQIRATLARMIGLEARLTFFVFVSYFYFSFSVFSRFRFLFCFLLSIFFFFHLFFHLFLLLIAFIILSLISYLSINRMHYIYFILFYFGFLCFR